MARLDLPPVGGRPLVADGAMGTALFAAGLPAGEAPEAWLLTEDGAAAVGGVHRGHVDAGARLVLTSSFGANPLRLAGTSLEGRGDEICEAAAKVARSAAGTSVIVAGSLGPTGGLLDPYGPLDAGAVRAAYAREAAALAAAGVDLLWVETMMDLREALAAVDGAREGAPGVPVVATLVFARGRTMFGDRPADAAVALAEHGVTGVGANCGDGFASVEDVIDTIAGAVPGLHVVAKANAGAPQRDPAGRTIYPATAAEASAYARRVADAGATIIGGCCGTTADHVRAMADALSGTAGPQ